MDDANGLADESNDMIIITRAVSRRLLGTLKSIHGPITFLRGYSEI